MAAEELEFRRLNVLPFIDRADDVACYGAYHDDVAKLLRQGQGISWQLLFPSRICKKYLLSYSVTWTIATLFLPLHAR